MVVAISCFILFLLYTFTHTHTHTHSKQGIDISVMVMWTFKGPYIDIWGFFAFRRVSQRV